MMVNNSVTGALVLLILAVVVIGLVAGLALSNSDLVNPYRNQAEAERMRQEVAIQAQRKAIDLQTYQREQELRLQALEQQQADEQAYRQARQKTGLALLQIGGLVIIGAVGVAIVMIGGAAAFSTIRLRPARAGEEELRVLVRRLARENERLHRELLLFGNGNGRREPAHWNVSGRHSG